MPTWTSGGLGRLSNVFDSKSFLPDGILHLESRDRTAGFPVWGLNP